LEKKEEANKSPYKSVTLKEIFPFSIFNDEDKDKKPEKKQIVL